MIEEKLHHPCPSCNTQMQPLACGVRVPSSEWYCHKCHKSDKMDEQTARFILAQESAQRVK